ncbi:MAG: hypothetical protein ABL958_06720 [Bdellovibrionia bacterium]
MFQSKLISFLTVLAASLSVSVSQAEKADDPICTDLHRVACTPGDVNDPTGVSRLPTVETGVLNPDVRQELKLNLATILKDPANSKVKKTLLKVAQLPDCEKDENSDGCFEALSQALALKIESRQISGMTSVSLAVATDAKISDLQAVLDAPVVAQAAAKMVESFRGKSGETDLIARAEKEIFTRVKEVMTIQVQELVGDEASRLLLLERIKAVQWGGTGCGAENLPSILTPDIFLNPSDNKVYVCRGAGRLGTSEYGLAFLISREFAMFISPCGATRGKGVPPLKYKTPSKVDESEAEFPFRGVLSCLRGKGSLFAQRGVRVSREPIAFCDKSDQISDSFVDWLAVEAVSDYIGKFLDKHSKQDKKSGIIGLMRSQCMPGAGLEFADRTPVEERFNRLLLSNPDVREQLGCRVKPLDVAYCAPVAPDTAPAEAEEKRE